MSLEQKEAKDCAVRVYATLDDNARQVVKCVAISHEKLKAGVARLRATQAKLAEMVSEAWKGGRLDAGYPGCRWENSDFRVKLDKLLSEQKGAENE